MYKRYQAIEYTFIYNKQAEASKRVFANVYCVICAVKNMEKLLCELFVLFLEC